MKKYVKITLLSLGLLICACNGLTTSKSSTDSASEDPQSGTAYFMAEGDQPSWKLSIADDSIFFTSTFKDFERLDFPSVEAIKAQDQNIKQFRTNTEVISFQSTIIQKSAMHSSNTELPYEVKLRLEKTKSGIIREFEGNGKYITDSRLNGKWLLIAVNGEKIVMEQLENQPYLELNTSINTFKANIPCNQLKGNLFYEKDLLRFNTNTSSYKDCDEFPMEKEFFQTLQGITSYNFENQTLILNNPSKKEIILKKMKKALIDSTFY